MVSTLLISISSNTTRGKPSPLKEVDPVYMSRAVMANDIPSVGV